MSATLLKVQDLFREVFDDDDLVLTPETTADDIQGWDSVMNVNLMLEMESEFGIQFNAGQVKELTNVGELVALLDAL